MDARTDPDFLIIARCDALAVNGWPDTIHRCLAYHQAGADLIFVDGITTVEELRTYARELAALPLLYNGNLATVAEVEKLGFKVMIHRASMLAVHKAFRETLEMLKATGSVDRSRIATREEVAELLGLSDIYRLEERYAVAPRNAP